jgi:3-deoxy-manno-octulosonate cytidylyltransferase (CMP-KDO synthetase)
MAAWMEAVLIIPARYGSTRLPGKPLAKIQGEPLIVRVVQQALKATRFSEVIVATDDVRIADAVEKVGGKAVMTSPEHESGTDRIAEAAQDVRAHIIVNLQGDEPFIDPVDLDNVADALAGDPYAEMATLKQSIVEERDFIDPNVVKVVTDERGYALYFSRAAIPYHRNAHFEGAYKHIGVYAFKREFLLAFASHARTPLEQKEGLEQLRALQMGAKIKVISARGRSLGIDTPEDLARAQQHDGPWMKEALSVSLAGEIGGAAQ